MRIERVFTIEEVREGNIKGQKIAVGKGEDGSRVAFDVIKDLIKIDKGDRVELVIMEKLESIDEYEFCGHGYLLSPEEKHNATILSLWGIIFEFTPPLGLKLEKKYYICARHL